MRDRLKYRRVSRDVIRRAGIELCLRACDRGRDALVLQLQVPPVLVVLVGLDRGFFGFGDTTLYVTPGVGLLGVTRRIGQGTDAEVAVLTFRAA